jgi:putative phosphoribosyl transferase
MKDEIQIPAGSKTLNATLTVPSEAIGLVVFSHGTGSGRHSPRNQYVAQELNKAGIATLLLDLLTITEEAQERAGGMNRFDIELLTQRLQAAALWCKQNEELSQLHLALFGASTGAASALRVAARLPEAVVSVVSRGGRPDLASDALPKVQCPVLLIVGGDDNVVIDLNEDALAELKCDKRLHIVPGATHLFEEPGTLEEVANRATTWFTSQFSAIK